MLMSAHHQGSSSTNSISSYHADSSVRASDSHLRQSQSSFPYSSQRCPTPTLGQRPPHTTTSSMPQRPGTSMSSSRVSSNRRPASAHHAPTAYPGHPPSSSTSHFSSMAHSQTGLESIFPSPASSPGAALTVPSQGYGSSAGTYNHTPLQVPSQSGYSSRHHHQTAPHSHARVQSMSVVPSSGHPSYLQHSATYPMTGSGMYMAQGLNVNTVDLSETYGVSSYPYPVSSSNPNHANSTSVSPLSPLNPNFPNSQSSSSPSPSSTPASTPIVPSRPRSGTVGSVPHLPQHYDYSSSQTYPATPARPFECDQCKLSFVRHHDLRRHKETHSGERVSPFPPLSSPFFVASCCVSHRATPPFFFGTEKNLIYYL